MALRPRLSVGFALSSVSVLLPGDPRHRLGEQRAGPGDVHDLTRCATKHIEDAKDLRPASLRPRAGYGLRALNTFFRLIFNQHWPNKGRKGA